MQLHEQEQNTVICNSRENLRIFFFLLRCKLLLLHLRCHWLVPTRVDAFLCSNYFSTDSCQLGSARDLCRCVSLSGQLRDSCRPTSTLSMHVHGLRDSYQPLCSSSVIIDDDEPNSTGHWTDAPPRDGPRSIIAGSTMAQAISGA